MDHEEEPQQGDLFGISKKKGTPFYHNIIRGFDNRTLKERAERLKYINSIFPKGTSLGGPPEWVYLYDEAKMAFMHGLFISTIFVVTAFIDQYLDSLTGSHKGSGSPGNSLKSKIDYAKKNEIAHSYLLEKIDRLRQIRNPYAHAKDSEHPYRLTRRMMEDRIFLPHELMEKDAKEALTIMYSVGQYI